MPAARPNCESLAISSASSSVLKRITAATGPNTSSCMMVIELLSHSNRVGS